MRWRKGQYLLFSKCVAKINRIGERGFGTIKLRKFSKGNTKLGYSYQQTMTLVHLNRLHKANKVRIISPEEIMQILLANFEGCMPIDDMRSV